MNARVNVNNKYKNMKNKLIQVCTSDGIYLHGYYIPSSDKKSVLLHIHGFEGNFYENNFIYVLADELEKNNIGFLTVNTRGNGSKTDFNTKSGEIVHIGGFYELLEEAHLDISAWIEFLIAEGYENIILQGHSLGTMKVVRYLFEGKYADKINKLILLAPFDMKTSMEVNGAKKWLSPKTYNSWRSDDDFGRMFEFCSKDYNFPILNKIKIPTKIIVGSKDEYFHLSNKEHPEEAMDILLKNIPNSQGIIIPDALHSYKPHEDIMVKEVIKFIKEA